MTIAYTALRRHLRLDADNPPRGGNGDNPPNQQASPPAGEGEDDDDDLSDADLSRLREAIRKERREKRDANRRANDLLSEKQKRDKADAEAQAERDRQAGDFKAVADREKAAREKAERERDEEREARKLDQVMTQITVEASGLNFHKPGEAHKFIDLSKVERDEDGRPKNVKQLVADLATNEKWLVKGDRAPGLPETPEQQGQAAPQSAVKNYIAARYGQPKAKQ